MENLSVGERTSESPLHYRIQRLSLRALTVILENAYSNSSIFEVDSCAVARANLAEDDHFGERILDTLFDDSPNPTSSSLMTVA